MSFTDDVVVREIGVATWALVAPLSYEGRQQHFTVPVGFETDFASVPRPLIRLIPRYGRYTKCAILHDYLLRTHAVNPKDADGIFRRSMNELEVAFVHRWLMWAAVRLGSHLSRVTARDILIWLLIALPSLAFVVIPFVVNLVWLALFWMIEAIFYLALRPFSHKPVRKPKFTARLS